jgi:Uncharacterized membrane protein, required for N-linked glycosylation
MSNYYEILNVPYAASPLEIEQALDTQYNKIRRLVTHHDSNVVHQANNELQMLEKIRSTLMDAGKRSAYNAAISPSIGVLIDPQINMPAPNSQPDLFVGHSPPTVTPTHSQPVAQLSSQRSWMCPKCQSVNMVKSQFCKHCGEILAAPCPACGQLVERNGEFCTSCGVNILRAKEKKEFDRQLGQAHAERQRTLIDVPIVDKNVPELNKLTVRGSVWAVVSLMAALTFLLATPGEHTGIDLSGPILYLIDGTKFRPVGLGNYISVFLGTLFLIIPLVFAAVLRKASPLPGLGAILAGILFIIGPKTVGYLLISSGLGGTSGAILALIMIVLFYTFAFQKILSITRKYFVILKPYYSRLPKAGFFGTLFSGVLSATPALYSLFLISFVSGLLNEFSAAMDRYSAYVLKINGVQLVILSILLTAYTLMGLRTAQASEVRYRQAVSERSEKTEKLTRQIQSLEQAIGQLDLQSR